MPTHAHVSLERIEHALDSLKGWPGGVVIIGGEPTLHPQFPVICQMLAARFPYRQRALFTMGGEAYRKHTRLIGQIFGTVSYHDHTPPAIHEPLLVAGYDIGLTKERQDELINRCWLQHNWCPAVGPRGAFVCEVMATLDRLIDGPGGWQLRPRWWERDRDECQEQVDRYCHACGIPWGIPGVLDTAKDQYVSEWWIDHLHGKLGPYTLMTPQLYNILRMNRPAHVHYAQPDGEHYRRHVHPAMWLRMKRAGLKYRAKKIAWNFFDKLGGVA